MVSLPAFCGPQTLNKAPALPLPSLAAVLSPPSLPVGSVPRTVSWTYSQGRLAPPSPFNLVSVYDIDFGTLWFQVHRTLHAELVSQQGLVDHMRP
jgi:hypothetical protein